MGFNTHTAAAIAVMGFALAIPSVQVTEPGGEPTEREIERAVPPLIRLLPISMSQAVEAAESVVPGQAINAQLELVDDRPVYEIQMMGIDRNMSTVEVDGERGEVAVLRDQEDQGQAGEDQTEIDRLLRLGEGLSI